MIENSVLIRDTGKFNKAVCGVKQFPRKEQHEL